MGVLADLSRNGGRYKYIPFRDILIMGYRADARDDMIAPVGTAAYTTTLRAKDHRCSATVHALPAYLDPAAHQPRSEGLREVQEPLLEHAQARPSASERRRRSRVGASPPRNSMMCPAPGGPAPAPAEHPRSRKRNVMIKPITTRTED